MRNYVAYQWIAVLVPNEIWSQSGNDIDGISSIRYTSHLCTAADNRKANELMLMITDLPIPTLWATHPLVLEWVTTKHVACHHAGVMPFL
jgi:hypothetical protein